MRQIKFRGKAVKSGKWLCGDLIHNRGKVYIADDSALTADCIQGHTDFEIYPETVGQFTGCTDRNGKEIYEGDILRITQDGKEPYATEVGTHGIIDYDTGYCDSTLLECVWSDCEVEIIGNRWDNPELMKGGEL